MSRILTLVCFCILTASCASTNNSPLIGADTPANNVNRLVDVSMGESLDLDGTTWTVERSYVAASGRSCKRLRSGYGETRVGCQDSNQQWYLRKPLMRGSSASAPRPASVSASIPTPVVNLDTVETPVASEMVDLEDIEIDVVMVESAVVPVDADVEAEALVVRENENLWRFSKRVTGNALNWEKIAAFNQLDNARAISAGQTLRVPTEWLVSGAGN